MQIRIVSSRDVEACPKHSLAATHYRNDGSCYCDSREQFEADVDRLVAELARARERLSRC